MEPKREVTSVDLRALCGDLDAYTGARVDKAYLYDDGLVRFKLRHFDHGRVELLVAVGDRKRINVAPAEYVSDAPERPPNFARMLRNRIGGAELRSVEQYEFDRIVRLEFVRDDEPITVVAELFGDGNLAVLDATDTVVDALRTVRLKSRTVAPGATYEYPDARLFPFGLDREPFEVRLRDSDADVVRTLATQLNLGGTYAEELCARAGVPAELDVEEADEDAIDGLYRALDEIGQRIRRGEYAPEIVLEDDAVVDVTPFELASHEGRDREAFDTMNEAVATYFHRLTTTDEEEPAPSQPDFEGELGKYDRMIAQQEAAIEDFQAEEAEMRERAEALYAHYDLVDEVITTIQEAREAGYDRDEIRDRLDAGAEAGLVAAESVVGIGDDGTVTVALEDLDVDVDPRHGVEQNADRLYSEAKRIAEKRHGAEEALEESRTEREAVEERRESWDSDEADDSDQGDEQSPTDWLDRSDIPVRSSEEWYERFRWFHTSDGFLVIGGRNADQNEELVQNYMEPHDRFVHAQAHGGPVTVLKATGPSEPSQAVTFPDRTIEQAAQFAVSYSSVWKAGQYAGDAYLVAPDQVSKEPESGEYLEKGGFVVRGDRTYRENVPATIAIGIRCEPTTQVIGGPPEPIRDRSAYTVTVEPGNVAQNDVAKRIYRSFREAFTDTTFVRKVASPDLIGEFLPPGHSRIHED